MVARFKIFRSQWDSWETMCTEVAEFLSEIGPDMLIGVSQSQESTLGVITVWYWKGSRK